MLNAFLLGAVAQSSLLLSGLAVYLVKVPQKAIGAFAGFGAGALIAAIAFDLIPQGEGLEYGQLALWLLIGGLVFIASDAMVESKFGEGGGSNPLGIVVGAVVDGIPVTITAYASEVEITDDEPFITASGRRVRPGTLAVSRDLLRTYTTDAPFDYGDRVRLGKYGEFVVDDTMNPRWTRRVDIWVPTIDEAQQLGKRYGRLYKLGESRRARGREPEGTGTSSPIS